MSAPNFTPIQLYRTTTASAVPSAGNLADGELAINLTDEALYFKNAAGVVTLLADSSGALGSVTSVNASGGTTGMTFSGGPVTSSGTLTLGGTLAVANGGTGVTTSTGTGSVVLSNSPTLVTPTLGVASATSIATGKGTVGSVAYGFTTNTNTGMWSPASDVVAFSTAGSERLRVDSSGNVGVGTASPGSFGRFAVVGSAGGAGILALNTDATRADIQSYNVPLAINRLGNNTLLNEGGGNVGIGTASPGNKLAVAGGQINTVADDAYAIALNATTGNVRILPYFSSYTGSALISYSAGYAGLGPFSIDAANIRLFTGSAERMRITPAGDVGIGTAAPARQVTINSAFPILQFTNPTTGTGASDGLLIFQSGLNATFSNQEAGAVILETANTERMRITAAGDVGIGTSSPDIFGRFYTRSVGINSSGTTALQINGTTYGAIDLGAGGTRTASLTGTATDAQLATITAIPLLFTTNSAERMRITSAGRVGIGTSSPAEALEVTSATAFARSVQLHTDQFGGCFVTANTAGTSASGSPPFNQNLVLQTNNAASFVSSIIFRYGTNGSYVEQARIDSAGNLGLGVVPGANDFTGVLQTRWVGHGITPRSATNLVFNMNANHNGGAWRYGNNGAAALYIQSDAGHGWYNAPSGTAGNAISFTEGMVLNASNNVGIGTSSPDIFGRGYTRTVGINSSGTTVLQINGTTYGAVDFGFNGTRTGTLLAETAGFYLQTTTSAPLVLGTNNTERMRIDSSGNVGIGTSSPFGDPGFRALDIRGSTGGQINLGTNSGREGEITSTATNGLTLNTINVTPIRFFINGFERMRLGTSGNLGIGTSTTTAYFTDYRSIRTSGSNGGALGLEVGGEPKLIMVADSTAAYLASYGGTPITFSTNSGNFAGSTGTERARIDSSGTLLVGKTATSATTIGAEIRPGGAILSTLAGSTNATSTLEVYSTGAAAYRFFVDMAGTINATSTSIAAISDIRLKENVRDLDAGLDTILALKPRRFDWKEGKGKDIRDDMGFIAQEVEGVLPELIGAWKAGEGEPDDLKSVKAGDLIPVLVKAIQELTARVAQLEGN